MSPLAPGESWGEAGLQALKGAGKGFLTGMVGAEILMGGLKAMYVGVLGFGPMGVSGTVGFTTLAAMWGATGLTGLIYDAILNDLEYSDVLVGRPLSAATGAAGISGRNPFGAVVEGTVGIGAALEAGCDPK